MSEQEIDQARHVSWCALAIVASTGIVAGCGGGGASGPSGAIPADGGTTPTAAVPSLNESSANYGILTIGARAAYARGAFGNGAKIAVIDSGIDIDHPEFAGRIDPASTDIVTGSAATLDDGSGHGTHVTGIAAASDDGVGMHGVAPDVTILAIRADLRNSAICSSPGCGYFDSDVARAIDYAVNQGAHVINLSIGKTTAISAVYQAALERAAASGVLVVNAAGNAGVNEPLFPGRLSNDPDMRGLLLTAGAVDANEQIWSSSNKPGSLDLAAHHLMAPGVNIYSTFPGGGYGRLTGTSMATPHVAGAAALLKSRFPSLTMRQIADLLLSTAEDLGAAGVDTVYGSGLVDIASAIAPNGGLAVPAGITTDGASSPVASASVELGTAFGDALAHVDALDHVMALDAYDRPYTVDLLDRVKTRPAGMDLESALVRQSDRRSVTSPIGDTGWTANSSFDVSRYKPVDGTLEARLSDRDAPELARLSLTSDGGSSGRVTVGMGLDVAEVGLPGRLEAPETSLFLDAQSVLLPDSIGVSDGMGVGYALALGDKSELAIGALRDNSGDDERRMVGARLTHHLGDVELGIGMGLLDEAGGLLGSKSGGALTLAQGAQTRFVEFDARWTPRDNLALFAQALIGESEINGGGTLFTDWSSVRSDSFALGAVETGVLGDDDRIGLMLSQPLRVSDASATVDVPVTRDLEGNVQRQTQRVDMAPDGRELNLQMAYDTPLGLRWRMSSWLLLQHEAGNDANRDLDAGIGLRLTRTFD